MRRPAAATCRSVVGNCAAVLVIFCAASFPLGEAAAGISDALWTDSPLEAAQDIPWHSRQPLSSGVVPLADPLSGTTRSLQAALEMPVWAVPTRQTVRR